MLLITAIKSAATLRAFQEIINCKSGGRNSDGELKVVSDTIDLYDINPDEKQFDFNPFQIGELVFGDSTFDCGLVTQGIRSLNGEGTSGTYISRESARGFVQVVALDALGQDSDGEIVLLDCIVDRGLF
jgi:hypothetical protein